MTDRKLLKSVSRSFYLTLRLLPQRLRDPLSLAYLLARATDTIADATDAPPAERLECLTGLLETRFTPAACGVERMIGRQRHPGEAELLRRLPGLLHTLEASPDEGEIRSVLGEIVRGQIGDVERAASGINHPLPEADLDRYLFHVAGSVGEFWTVLGFKYFPGYARTSKQTMIENGIAYGKGLQLLNILRDYSGDADRGRIYIAAGDFERLKGDAAAFLQCGVEYVRALRVRRVRYACVLPLAIADRMLPRLAPGRAVKLPRREIRRIALRMLPWLVAPRRRL